MYNSSNKYLLITQHYSPKPLNALYHGVEGRKFKKVFAGEMTNPYRDLKVIAYGFVYHRDRNFLQDDLNWFLLEKWGKIHILKNHNL